MPYPRLHAGIAETDINSPANSFLAVELERRPSHGTAAPLAAKALVLSNGIESLALVTLDLFGLDADGLASIQSAVTARCGLENRQIMLVCSHNRTAPATIPLPGGGDVEPGFVSTLAEPIARLVETAMENRQAAALGLGYARLPHLVYNQRLLTRNMKAISAWMGTPPNEVLAPEGPTDPELSLLVVRDARGFPICLIWNCVADNRFSGGSLIGPGLPFAVQEALDARVGRHIPCLYLPGCGANVSYIHELEMTTDLVTSGVMAVQMETSADPAIKLVACCRRMILPVRDYSHFWSRADIALKYPQAEEWYATELKLLQEQGQQGVPANVQVFQLGRFALIGLPGMPFVETALFIKEQSPFWGTVVAGNANAYIGRIATRQAFDHGGYETWPSRCDRVGPGAAEFMAEQATSILSGLWKQRSTTG